MVKKFIKNINYSKDEIAINFYYRENPGEEITQNDASGCVRAATGKDKISDSNKEILAGTGRENNFKCSVWLPSSDSFQTIEIILPNTIHGCKRKNLKHL